jgi:hypothetical protein
MLNPCEQASAEAGHRAHFEQVWQAVTLAHWAICLVYVLLEVSSTAVYSRSTMADIQRIGVDEIIRHFAELEDPRSTINRQHPPDSAVVIALMATPQ